MTLEEFVHNLSNESFYALIKAVEKETDIRNAEADELANQYEADANPDDLPWI